VIGGLEIREAKAVWNDLGTDVMAGLRVGFEHLARDLGVTRLVGTDKAQLIASEGGDEAIEQKKAADQKKNQQLKRD
jgi:hypothetical protein